MKFGIVGNTLIAFVLIGLGTAGGFIFNHVAGGAIIGCCLAIVYIMIVTIMNMVNN